MFKSMKPLNLRNIVYANKGLPTAMRDSLFDLWEIKPKPSELMALEYFIGQCDAMAPYGGDLVTQILGGCYFGFEIPRISKEFDCLWIGEKTVANVELKSKDVGGERIKRQLEKNRYYLNFLKKDIRLYTVVVSTGHCYSIDTLGNLTTVSFKDIAIALKNIHQEVLYVGDIEDLFPPEQYLVSPFNSTDEFLKGYYFLTDQQQKIKDGIIDFVNDPSAGCYCALTGGPGSGKTLLLYDIARTLMQEGKSVVIGQAGLLNNGHNKLIENGWQIKVTNHFHIYNHATGNVEFVDADVYLVDETQRCYNLNQIIQKVGELGRKCIFSFDSDQVMSNSEEKRDNGNMLKALVGSNCYKLTSNVRTNAVVYDFIKALFDKNHSVNKGKRGFVELTYCPSEAEAILMLHYLRTIGYMVPKFTPKQYGSEDYEILFPTDVLSAHEVIGQEFNAVVGLVRPNMCYAPNGKLMSRKGTYYREDKMLYQILSRARQKIHLIIVDNPGMLERCMKLIG